MVDSPPTGRITRFLDVTKALSDIAKGGPVHSQAEGVVKLLHSEQTAIHLVTLLEALPIQETIEAIEELEALELPVGGVIVNRNIPAFLPEDALGPAADGVIDAEAVRAGLSRAGITMADTEFAGLLTETIEHASRIRARSESATELEDLHVPRLESADDRRRRRSGQPVRIGRSPCPARRPMSAAKRTRQAGAMSAAKRTRQAAAMSFTREGRP